VRVYTLLSSEINTETIFFFTYSTHFKNTNQLVNDGVKILFQRQIKLLMGLWRSSTVDLFEILGSSVSTIYVFNKQRALLLPDLQIP
jgi:antitoxin component HigA of HigAB toxin-antitoxin module